MQVSYVLNFEGGKGYILENFQILYEM